MRNGSLRRAALAFPLLGTLALVWGCGGGGGASATRMATAEFNIRWPDGASRTIPTGTNRFVIYVNGDGMSTQAYIVDVPNATNRTYTYRVPVPPGTKRLFSAVARQVASTKYSGITPVAINSPDLTAGDALGAGIDPQPYDIAPATRTTANVEIQLPGQPGAGITNITGRVNQVLAPSFPSVAMLGIFRDQDGNPITNLNIANLEVLEDGIPVVITDVRTVGQAGQPISVCLVLDRSGSMGYQGNADLEQAASTFVNLMGANDAGEVVNFSTSVSVDQPFTTDKSLLLAAIQGRSAGGSTALWSAAYQGVTDTAQRGGRMAVLLMTDGYDNNSSHTQDQVIAAANAGGVPIFTIGLGSSVDPGLAEAANQTGGLAFVAPTSADLDTLYQKISGQLSGQMQITFISADPIAHTPPKQRVLEIRLKYGSLQQTTTAKFSM